MLIIRPIIISTVLVIHPRDFRGRAMSYRPCSKTLPAHSALLVYLYMHAKNENSQENTSDREMKTTKPKQNSNLSTPNLISTPLP